MFSQEMKELFGLLFIVENRLTTACEKIQTEISMKQWLLLALVMTQADSQTLTELGKLMGCSRQNIKKLALALEQKGLVQLKEGPRKSYDIQVLPKAYELADQMALRHETTLRLLFSDFSQQEIQIFHRLYSKLEINIKKVEDYANEMD
ncbi:MarR family winged helix-turn-helix transcriptional regulator [Vaginisenegalia massiliensis]|uniref:MarR family winged helix-turn-helix transcriptional regulator n=1 Tax=Vaginisenegalia massiliensis TaxID=2058294 RepID=UPI000F5202B9|nr:MarR family transcriptional regulator [Vaginisenegalia massiliensis]